MTEKLLYSAKDADELGAFPEDALSEEDATAAEHDERLSPQEALQRVPVGTPPVLGKAR